jgi:2-amino-4-hydroxy-6-hydroxymethyldihydropteridine diphosphokinase
MSRVFVGLGSNQDDPPVQLAKAVEALAELPETRLMAVSPQYWTAPVGDDQQPEFLNAVVELETALEPLALLIELQRIEDRHGRTRDPGRRWGPRTLDLDLLLFDHRVVRCPELVVPHTRLAQRAFVLVPLSDLAPGFDVPTLGRVSALLARLDRSGVRPAIECEPGVTP